MVQANQRIFTNSMNETITVEKQPDGKFMVKHSDIPNKDIEWNPQLKLSIGPVTTMQGLIFAEEEVAFIEQAVRELS